MLLLWRRGFPEILELYGPPSEIRRSIEALAKAVEAGGVETKWYGRRALASAKSWATTMDAVETWRSARQARIEREEFAGQ